MRNSIATLAPALTLAMAFGPTVSATVLLDGLPGQPEFRRDFDVRTFTGSVPDAAVGTESIAAEPILHLPITAPAPAQAWMNDAVVKVLSYLDEAAGWKGDGTLPPSSETVSCALDLLSQLATEISSLTAPSISADEDGSIYFYWRGAERVATIAAHEDGTYSYYAENSIAHARSSSAPVGLPLPGDLLLAMLT